MTILVIFGCNRHPDYYYYESWKLSAREKYVEALEMVEKALALDSLNPDYIKERAKIYDKMGANDKALQDYYSYLRYDSNNAIVLRDIGTILEENCDYFESSRYFKKSIEIDSTSTYALLYLAMNEFKLGNYAECKHYAEMANKVNPDIANPYNELGLVYTHYKNWDLAILNFTEAIKRDSSWPHYYNNRGYAYSQIDSMQSAIDDYKAAIQLNATDEDFYLNLADAFNILGQNDSALWYYDKSISLIKPGYEANLAIAFYNRAYLRLKMGDTISAQGDFEFLDSIGYKSANHFVFGFNDTCSTTYNNGYSK